MITQKKINIKGVPKVSEVVVKVMDVRVWCTQRKHLDDGNLDSNMQRINYNKKLEQKLEQEYKVEYCIEIDIANGDAIAHEDDDQTQGLAQKTLVFVEKKKNADVLAVH